MTKRPQRSVSAGIKSDQKPFYDAGIPNPIILQMNYAQAIKRSPREVAAARAAAAAAAAASFTTVSSFTTTTTTTAATKSKGSVHHQPTAATGSAATNDGCEGLKSFTKCVV
ncbi:hypothetical protein BGZ89_006597 [Linnemannia elongata]|nr:hypothetical protein BGZ89_006597 [Linnemannia elongata]